MLRGLEGLSTGVILAASDGRLVFANCVADQLLSGGTGLRIKQQRLWAMTPALTQELRRRVRDAADTTAGSGQQAGGTLFLPCAAGDKVSLLICPFPIAAGSVPGPTVPLALVFVAGPDRRPALRRHDLRQLYDLTAAEAKLVGALLAGATLQDYAVASGISAETAKAYLRQVFAKTGQHRQADLIRHILSNPILPLAAKEIPAARS